MTDSADDAQMREELFLSHALLLRKPTPTICEECGIGQTVVLDNGAHARLCADCVAERQRCD